MGRILELLLKTRVLKLLILWTCFDMFCFKCVYFKLEPPLDLCQWDEWELLFSFQGKIITLNMARFLYPAGHHLKRHALFVVEIASIILSFKQYDPLTCVHDPKPSVPPKLRIVFLPSLLPAFLLGMNSKGTSGDWAAGQCPRVSSCGTMAGRGPGCRRGARPVIYRALEGGDLI